jgi:predicted Zn-dependent protease
MSSADQRYDEAIELQQAGKLEEAVGKLESLLAEFPDYALAHAALSVFYGKQDRHAEAAEHAQKVCELEPDDPFSYMALSIVCQRAGKNLEAEQAMTQAVHKQWELRQKSQDS